MVYIENILVNKFSFYLREASENHEMKNHSFEIVFISLIISTHVVAFIMYSRSLS